MYQTIRPILFRLEPECAHDLTLSALRLVQALPGLATLLRRLFAAPPQPVQAFGLQFSNPVGLAAGYDKDGAAWRSLACLGFGHLEIGTVTLRPQVGNPQPRVFRLPGDQALINRMGFPGKGAEFVRRNLQSPRLPGLVLGVNLGKNKDTPLEEAGQDYLALVKTFAPLADYLAINISSPNTVGLRRLQARDALVDLLGVLLAERIEQERHLGRKVPMLIKLAPDLLAGELEDAVQVIQERGMDGIIAANTTLSRDGVHSDLANETGGLSGAPLTKRNTAMIETISRLTAGKLPIIGVGGVMGPDDARAKLDAGATLVQVYTGLVFQGPGLVKQILTAIET
jgi:dihydroorotate dehydrogenase